MISKNSLGRITVHDVPKISATQKQSRMGPLQPRLLGDEVVMVSTELERSIWLLLEQVTCG